MRYSFQYHLYNNWYGFRLLVEKPILGFSKPKITKSKSHLDAPNFLAYDGIHFGNIMREIAKEVGGTGGGHAIACVGAYIPNEKIRIS